MTPFAFDTLSASKRLREAGMEEGVAEAVVSIFQHGFEPIDISHLASKADVNALRGEVNALHGDVNTLRADVDALRGDVDALRGNLNTLRGDVDTLRVSTKADFDGIRAEMATKTDLAALKNEVSAEVKIAEANLRADINDKFRQQSWTMLGGMAVLLAIATGTAKLLG